MRVTVKHYALIKKEDGQSSRHVDMEEGGNVDELLILLGLKQEEVGILIVNGKEASWGQILKENDVVTLIPHIGGG